MPLSKIRIEEYKERTFNRWRHKDVERVRTTKFRGPPHVLYFLWGYPNLSYLIALLELASIGKTHINRVIAVEKIALGNFRAASLEEIARVGVIYCSRNSLQWNKVIYVEGCDTEDDGVHHRCKTGVFANEGDYLQCNDRKILFRTMSEFRKFVFPFLSTRFVVPQNRRTSQICPASSFDIDTSEICASNVLIAENVWLLWAESRRRFFIRWVRFRYWSVRSHIKANCVIC